MIIPSQRKKKEKTEKKNSGPQSIHFSSKAQCMHTSERERAAAAATKQQNVVSVEAPISLLLFYEFNLHLAHLSS